ncbi:glutamic acid-rich protein-like [Calliphora vicina]|uniref:glutamic acid-rich protein-like n=1 Tax=Calliphora vicina TaxID=7373 RepID=UPI00325A5FE8
MDKLQNIKSINLEQMVKVISLSKRVKNPLDIKKTFNISLINIHFILQNQNEILERWRQIADLNGIAIESSENINLDPIKLQKSCSSIKEGNSEHKNNDASRTMEHQETHILNESNEDVIFIETPIKCIDITNDDTAAYNNIVKIKKEPSSPVSVRKEKRYATSLMDFPPLKTIKLELERENTKSHNIKQESWEYIENGTNIRPVQIKNEIDDEIDEFEEFLNILDEQTINPELEFMEDDETEYIDIYKIVDTEDEDDEGLDNKENANDLHKTEIEISSIKNELNNYSCPQIKLEQNDKLIDTLLEQTSKVENSTTTNTPAVGEDDDSEMIELVYEIEESNDLHKTEIERSLIKKELNNYSCQINYSQQIKLEQNVDKLLDTLSKQTSKVENSTTTNIPAVGEDEELEVVYEIEESDDLHKTEIERSLIKKELSNYSCPQIKIEQNDKLLDTMSEKTSKVENSTTTNTPAVGEDDDSEMIELVYEIEESDEDIQNELMEIINKHKNTKPEICAYENHYGNKQEIEQEPLDEDAAKEGEEEEEEVITVLEIVSDDETVDYDKQDEESDLLKPIEVIKNSKSHRKQIHEDIHGTYSTVFYPSKSKSNVNDNIPSTSRSFRKETVPTSTPANKKAPLCFNLSEDLITFTIKSNKCVNHVLEYFQRQKDVDDVKRLHKLQLCFCDKN